MMFLSDPRQGPQTFADPVVDRPFSVSLPGPFPGGHLVTDAMLDIAKNPKLYRDIFVQAERQERLTDMVNSEGIAREEALDRRIEQIRDATGVALENPLRGGYRSDAGRRIRRELIEGGYQGGGELGGVPAMQQRIFDEKVAELRRAHPDKIGDFDVGGEARSIAHQAEETRAPPATDTVAGFATQFAGAMVAHRRDPVFALSLFAGPTSSFGKLALSRVATSGLVQGIANMGITLAEQPAVQAWRAEIGVRNGVMPAAENVGLAFLFGLIPGAAIQGFKELNRTPRAALERIAGGRAEPGDLELITKEIKLDADPSAVKTTRAGENAVRAEDVAAGPPPAGVARAEHDAVVAQAIRHGEDPANNPPPELPIAAPARPKDQVRVIDEREPVERGAVETVDGKPVTFERIDPAQLGTDAATFQYKGGGDAEGVTDRLRHVTRWDPVASGKAIVFERADGTRVVADGHQRLGLATRIAREDPAQKVQLDAFVFREADGWTPADVRAMAAKKNMQEGSGDAIDAARILRERPDLLDGALPVSGPMMKNAIALARLSDEAFGMAVNGVVPGNYAAAVGSMVADPLQHVAVMADLARFKPETEREAKLLIGEILSAGFRTVEQIDLFGAATTTRSLMDQRVRILDTALQDLVKDKKLFGTLAQQAEAIEGAGNVLARGTNQQRAADAAQLADMLARLAQRTGPVSDALNRAAAKMAEGLKRGQAVEQFLDDVRALLDRDGLQGLLAAPELKPRVTVEPGTPEALQAAESASGLRVTLAPAEGGFEIRNAAGATIGEARVTIAGTTATIDDIAADVPIGPAGMRDLLQQLRAAHPEITHVEGWRISGARGAMVRQPRQPEGAGFVRLALPEAGSAGHVSPLIQKSEGVATSAREGGDLTHQRPSQGLEFFQGDGPGLIPRQNGEAFQARRRAELLDRQPFATLDEALAAAPARQAELVAALEEAAAGRGAVKDPGVKADRARIEQKIAEKYEGDPRRLTDVVRAGVTPDSPQAADEIVAALSQKHRVIDEGWNVNEAGYLDRKLELILPDGTVTEIQMWPKSILQAKQRGEAMYVERRAAPPAARAAMLELERAYWADARAELDASWSAVMGGSPSRANVSDQAARAAASESARPSQPTSAELTGRQPDLPAAKAEDPATTATVSPQENQRMSGDAGIRVSNENVASPAAEIKAPDLIDSIAVAANDDGRNVRFISREAALADADRPAQFADLVAACKVAA